MRFVAASLERRLNGVSGGHTSDLRGQRTTQHTAWCGFATFAAVTLATVSPGSRWFSAFLAPRAVAGAIKRGAAVSGGKRIADRRRVFCSELAFRKMRAAGLPLKELMYVGLP